MLQADGCPVVSTYRLWPFLCRKFPGSEVSTAAIRMAYCVPLISPEMVVDRLDRPLSTIWREL